MTDSSDTAVNRKEQFHQRRVRCYEFAHVVPWGEIVSGMTEENDLDTDQ